MTPAQRDLILHSLGLTPRNGRMPRWSYRNRYVVPLLETPPWPEMAKAGWVEAIALRTETQVAKWYRVTRAGAEAAGVLDRCRREDLGR